MEKPVIILGGGIWGSLLAYRLKETLPHLAFRLYSDESQLGDHQSCSFRESDCASSMKWIRPLISHSWNQHHIKCASFEKWITNPYHLIESDHLHKVVSQKVGPALHMNNTMDIEFALQSGSFVIDTRNKCHYKKNGYRKWLSLEVELLEDHHLIAPVVFDGRVECKERARNLYYLPLSPKKLLIKDFWLSEDKKISLDEMENSLMNSIKERGWKVGRIIREESGTSELPLSSPIIRQEGRVVNLAGLFHDTTGCSISSATRLIDRMVQTSFRFGEIKEVVKAFRQEEENDRKFFRFLNRQIIEKDHPQLLEAVYHQPYEIVEKFSRGRLTFLDRSRITLGKTTYKFSSLMNMVLPYAFYPRVQYRVRKVSEI